MTEKEPNSINNTAYFMLHDIKFDLKFVTEPEMDSMMKDPETGQPRTLFGYSSFVTESGRLWPLPVNNIEVKYDPPR